jgi:uncharacterized protein (TIGR02001 family)
MSDERAGSSNVGRGHPESAMAQKLQKGSQSINLRYRSTPMKKSLICLSVLASFVGAVHAEDAPAVTSNLTLTTKYKYRGQDQSSNADKNITPALQGGFDYAKNGFYVGNWNSSIGWLGGSDLEVDVYGGYKGEITKDFAFDVGALRYQYPQGAIANTTELYGALTWSIVTAKLSYTASKRYFGFDEGRGTLYADLSANYEIVKGVTLNGHLGATRFSDDAHDAAAAAGVGLANYIDYKLGATYDIGSGFSAAAAFVGGNKKDTWGDLNKGRLIVSITKAM